MAIDSELFRSSAMRGEVAGVALDCGQALSLIAAALEIIAMGEKPDDDDIKIIRETAKRLSERFDELVGWTDE